MKYTISEHEAWFKRAYEESGIYATEAAAHFADLLAEVKRLHESDPAIAAIEKSITALKESERDTIADLQARLADAATLLEKLKKAQCLGGHPMFLGALVRQDIDDLIARIKEKK